MKYGKMLILLILALLVSGCIDDITSRFKEVQVVNVNVSVIVQDNVTIIQSIEANLVEVKRLEAFGMVIPEKFPAIYVEVLQQYNNSNAGKTISLPNGQLYNGPGNYSFNVQLYDNSFNKSRPLFVYSEIIKEDGGRVARKRVSINQTE